jgi:hypothetical protein
MAQKQQQQVNSNKEDLEKKKAKLFTDRPAGMILSLECLR